MCHATHSTVSWLSVRYRDNDATGLWQARGHQYSWAQTLAEVIEIGTSVVLVAIVICEIAFWVALLAGLCARYLLRRPRLGAALLISVPAIDAVLLILVAIDLLRGGTASWQHGLAAIYIGISIAYGRRMVAWLDTRFTYYFMGGPKPEKVAGTAYTMKCWRDVLLTLVAVVISAAILGGLILLVNHAERTAELHEFFRLLGIIFAVDFLWAVSYTIWRKPEQQARTRDLPNADESNGREMQ